MSVIKAEKFQASFINFSDSVKVNKYGGKSVYANYKGSPLRLQMPKMNLPFGVSKYQNPDKPEEIKYSLEMSCANLPESVLAQLKEMEDKVIAYAETKSKDLFKKQQSKELILEFYKSFIKYSEVDGERDDKYAPRLKAKIYTDGTNFNVAAYESEKVNGNYPKVHITEDNVDEIIQKGSRCEAIIECTGIWVVNKSFGVSWKLAQLKLYPNENQLADYAFIKDDDEDINGQQDVDYDDEYDEVKEVNEVSEVDGLEVDGLEIEKLEIETLEIESSVKPKRKARETRSGGL